jgi:type 1 glutamine amidotransferase
MLSVVIVVLTCLLCAWTSPAEGKKIVLLAGKVGSHDSEEHEYLKGFQLMKYCLETSPNLEGVEVEVHANGWPKDPGTLDDADTIVLYSDGADYGEENHPFLVGDRMSVIDKQVERGCGLVFMHYATIVPRKHQDKWLNWVGGYFDYETGPPPNNWYSRIKWTTSSPVLATPEHPISRGIRPFAINEEYYYNLRFPKDQDGWAPIWTTPIAGEALPQVVAWGIERGEGGRGFGTTCGHDHANLLLPDFLKLHLNAIVWTAGMDVPAGGVEFALPEKADWMPKGKPRTWDSREGWDEEEAEDEDPLRALIITGHDHPAHNWRKTSGALREILWRDSRFLVDVTHDPETMASRDISAYDVIVLNYCNWESPGLSDAAKQNFVKYLSGGGGLGVIHFAVGAWHGSLPGATESDWPEYRKICTRVWDYNSDAGHDEYQAFRVEVTNKEHPITEGLKLFETIDELYYGLAGNSPIDLLASARSTLTGQEAPVIWVSEYKKARVFQTVLGHSEESLRVPYVTELIRRGCVWAAGR